MILQILTRNSIRGKMCKLTCYDIGKLEMLCHLEIHTLWNLEVSQFSFLSSLVSRVEDKNEQGKLSYVEFFSRLGVTVQPGDTEGLSTQIQQSHDYEAARHAADQGQR